jgi:hypothetical protein
LPSGFSWPPASLASARPSSPPPTAALSPPPLVLGARQERPICARLD